jgi:hypothetical protein
MMNYQPQSGYMPHQMQQQLPFDPTRLMSQVSQFRLDSPPCIPNGAIAPPQLSHLLPAACALAANMIGATAQNHAGRTFLYNQLSVNGFANNEFARVISTTFDLLGLGLGKGQYRNPEDGLQDAVAKSLSLASALNFETYPALQTYVPQEIYNDAINNLNSLQNISSEIANMRNVGYAPNTPLRYPSHQPQSTHQQGYQQPQNTHQMHGGRFENRQPTPIGGYPTNTGVQNSLFNNRGAVPFNASAHKGPSVAMDSDRFNNYRPASAVSQHQHFERAPAQQEQTYGVLPAAPVFAELTIDDWATSEEQRYVPTINPLTHKLVFEEVESKKGRIVIATATELQEDEMNREDHRTGIVPTAVRSHLTAEDKEKNHMLLKGTSLLLDSTKSNLEAIYDEEEAKKIKTVCSKEVLVDTAFETLVFRSRLFMARASQANENAAVAFRTNCVLAKPIITENSQEGFLNRLRDCKSFASISRVLKQGLSDPDLIKLVSTFDKAFTKELNSILQNKLSVTIDATSFIEDSYPMIDHLAENYGLIIAKEYQRCEDDFISTYFDQGILNEEWIETLYQNFGIGDVDPDTEIPFDKINISYITQKYTMLFLAAHSNELGVGLQPGMATGLSYKDNMSLWLLAKDVFSKDSQNTNHTAHVLVITGDDVIYELHVGLMGDDFYTISLFN